jgi:hypothetical protein
MPDTLLFDTLIVRSFMTPSIAALLGRWFWWPMNVRSRPARANGQRLSGDAGFEDVASAPAVLAECLVEDFLLFDGVHLRRARRRRRHGPARNPFDPSQFGWEQLG